jgi:hypothetical protein
MRRFHWIFLLAVAALFSGASPAGADHGNADQASPNMIHVANVEKPGVNSDLAFWVNLAAQGSFSGFRLLDITKPESPVVLSTVQCNSPQGDVSFYKAKDRLLLIVSVDNPQTNTGPPPGGKDCASSNIPVGVGFEGLRIWDVTNPVVPKFVTAVQTDCGSHTHTTIADEDNQRGIVYVSSYPTQPGPECGQPNPAACNLPHAKISIVEIPDAAPASARVLKEQPLHCDTVPSQGGEAILGSVGCHDITAFFAANEQSEGDPKKKPQVAAAACLSEGQLWDISDPANPDTLGRHTHIRNEAIEIWHSSTFTWDANIVLFGDEHGGGLAHGCDAPAETFGNLWFYKNVPPGSPDAPLLGRYMIPRSQPASEVCTLHNFNVIPINDNEAYIGVSSTYEGGTTVFEFTELQRTEAPVDPLDPFVAPIVAREIAFYDAQTGAPHESKARADTFSTYWYNDFLYANDGLAGAHAHRTDSRGLDVFKLLIEPVPLCAVADRCGGKQFTARKFHHMNPQTQEVFETLGG